MKSTWKIAKLAKQIIEINFPVAFFALLSKRKKETLNKLTTLRTDVTSCLASRVIVDRRSKFLCDQLILLLTTYPAIGFDMLDSK